MFEKFGELNSFGEINELAENLFNEGDTESLRAMAKENGIQSDFVDMYLQGEIPALCDQLTAALGKIDVEVAELKPKEIMEDWVEYLRGQCMENELLAFNVRKKGKSLKGCIAALLMWSFKNQQTVDKDIIKAAGVSAGKVTLGIPGMARAKQIITDDFPDKYVARIYELDRATDTIMVKETLEEITADIKEHTAMTFIPRGTADVPSLVGVWM